VGKKSSKQTTTNEPAKWAKPYLTGAASTIQNTVDSNQGHLDQMAGDMRGYLPQLGQMAFGQNAGLNAATGYATDVLGGKYLGEANPYLNQMVDTARGNTMDSINSNFAMGGRVGSDLHFEDLGRGMMQAETGLRYGDYQNERNQMTQAAGLMPGLNASQYAGVMPYLAMSQGAAQLPYTGIGNLGMIGGLAGGYGTQTQPGPGWGQSLLGAAVGLGSAALGNPAIMASARELKTDIEEIGEWDGRGDGLKKYRFRYKSDPSRTLFEGVMADEVLELRPHAYVPNFHEGKPGVNYAKLSEAAK
jgi:hypothetical protein